VRDADVLVAGAGPAGLASALALTQRGLRVLVIERRSAPLDKACGEGIMPLGVRALAALGVDTQALGAAPFRGVRFLDGERELTGAFSSGCGLGVRRTALSAALLARAQQTGVRLQLGCALHSWREERDGVVAETSAGRARVRTLVGADGLASRVRVVSGLALPPARVRRFGVRRHFRAAPWSDCVEVLWGEAAQAFVTPVAPDEVGIALLWSGDGGSFDDLLGRFPTLAARLAGADAVSEARGAGPFWQGARARHAGRVALVGDAAGYTDAVTGEGITLALRSALALAETLAAAAPLERYERAWRRLTRAHRALARLLALGVAHPRARRAAFAALATAPSAFTGLLRIAAGESMRARAIGASSAATSSTTFPPTRPARPAHALRRESS
jgi:flavin-dependent dehydrogenase